MASVCLMMGYHVVSKEPLNMALINQIGIIGFQVSISVDVVFIMLKPKHLWFNAWFDVADIFV